MQLGSDIKHHTFIVGRVFETPDVESIVTTVINRLILKLKVQIKIAKKRVKKKFDAPCKTIFSH